MKLETIKVLVGILAGCVGIAAGAYRIRSDMTRGPSAADSRPEGTSVQTVAAFELAERGTGGNATFTGLKPQSTMSIAISARVTPGEDAEGWSYEVGVHANDRLVGVLSGKGLTIAGAKTTAASGTFTAAAPDSGNLEVYLAWRRSSTPDGAKLPIRFPEGAEIRLSER